jgi:hypothetical protein
MSILEAAYKNLEESYENISEFLLSVSIRLNDSKRNIDNDSYQKNIEKYLYFADRALEITKELESIIKVDTVICGSSTESQGVPYGGVL